MLGFLKKKKQQKRPKVLVTIGKGAMGISIPTMPSESRPTMPSKPSDVVPPFKKPASELSGKELVRQCGSCKHKFLSKEIGIAGCPNCGNVYTRVIDSRA